MTVLRLSENRALRSTGCALVEDYLRLADAWGGDTPAVLPAAHQAIVDGCPGDASPPGGDALIAATADAVLGQVLVVPHSVDVGKVERLYVMQAARRRGLGTALLSTALDLANSLGYRSVVPNVMPRRHFPLRALRIHSGSAVCRLRASDGLPRPAAVA